MYFDSGRFAWERRVCSCYGSRAWRVNAVMGSWFGSEVELHLILLSSFSGLQSDGGSGC